ncbi:HTH-type transcriptional repressor RspR [Methylobacterium crusticola]|uniref:HTH-type transcriptional repressor RspR n=1 Tax=Methylobacterium crusticola TaxID=1697972 RepID=A0ABQ4QX13_9HYPH|nr:GntR family transcriptional regulator [Methylobacterium crusticola]GJD49601.1 HTH-type transcriptional repressor RspR [Methylobacterium crusticola]
MERARAARDEAGARRTSLVDDAYAAMREAIRSASFAPGYQASEQEIATRLGMSRTPVHEAAIRLQEDGLVKVLPRRGILICAIAPDDLREIYDVIIAVEGQAAELVAGLPAAERAHAAGELARQTSVMEAAQAGGDLTAWGPADEGFHRTLVEQAGNGRMIRIMRTVNDQAHRARMLTLKLRRELDASLAEHHGIVAAIRAGDGGEARERARQHRVRARNELLPLLAELGLKHL